jgi:two-component system, LytTR family, response regulator
MPQLKKLNAIESENEQHYLSITDATNNSFIKQNTIVLIEAVGLTSILFLNNGNQHTINKTLNTIIKDLPQHIFLKINEAHIVNIAFVNRYVNETEKYLVMYDGTQVPIANNQTKAFKDLMKTLQNL